MGTKGKREMPWMVTPPYQGFQSYSHCRSPESERKYKCSEDYFKELRMWLNQAYFWQSVTAQFPYYLMAQQSIMSSPRTPNVAPPTATRTQPTPQADTHDGLECKIPSFWKRMVAEIIDFLILLLLKLGATYVALDIVDIMDLEKLINVHKEATFEYQTILKMTEGLVILEMIHRIVVCLFETIWLKGGVNGRIGGASPGKSIMKLRVVRCETVTPLEANNNQNNQGLVIVRPGTDLGLGLSFVRAAVKNFVIAVLIPTSFALFYFPNNRTGYDMICNTIVIEEPIRVHRPHQD